jgi:type I restriction enzyme S subunit
MTLNKDFKKLVRAHKAKTGKSYAGALADLMARSGTDTDPEVPAGFPLDATDLAKRLGISAQGARDLLLAAADPYVGPVLRQLRVDTPFGVVTRKSPVTGAGADPEAARRQAAEAARNPTWYAESGAVEQFVPEEISRKLLRYGAADGIRIQVFRAREDDPLDRTFSKQCRRCRRWIWLGDSERQAACDCGQIYRVAFDLAKVFGGTGTPGLRCLHCGKEQRAGSKGWKKVNDWQFRCDNCDSRGVRYFQVYCDYETPERAGAGGMFQVIELTEDGEDVTDLVDQGILFIDLNHLRRHLQGRLGPEVEVDVEEVG